MNWTHRACWPNAPATRDTDRSVLFGEIRAGRVTYQEGGPQDGRWLWSAYWANGVGSLPIRHSGTEPTLAEALDALRRSYLAALDLRPDLNDQMRWSQERAMRTVTRS